MVQIGPLRKQCPKTRMKAKGRAPENGTVRGASEAGNSQSPALPAAPCPSVPGSDHYHSYCLFSWSFCSQTFLIQCLPASNLVHSHLLSVRGMSSLPVMLSPMVLSVYGPPHASLPLFLLLREVSLNMCPHHGGLLAVVQTREHCHEHFLNSMSNRTKWVH